MPDLSSSNKPELIALLTFFAKPLKGTAKVEINNQTLVLSENESTYIPLGSKHRLSNPGKIPLEIIEVQSGNYIGEDDIVRFEDKYGRTNYLN